MHPDASTVLAQTRAWVERAVIGLNLCPFAKGPQVRGLVRYVVSQATDNAELQAALREELTYLANTSPTQVETTLLIHPQVLGDFLDYNDFLELADDTIADLDLTGVLQVASFHPDYQFAGTASHDITNATNRAPWPTLHLLREASIEHALAAFPDPESIYTNNLATLERLGPTGWAALQQQCRADAEAAITAQPPAPTEPV